MNIIQVAAKWTPFIAFRTAKSLDNHEFEGSRSTFPSVEFGIRVGDVVVTAVKHCLSRVTQSLCHMKPSPQSSHSILARGRKVYSDLISDTCSEDTDGVVHESLST